MANYTNLKQSVKNAIKNNGRQDITGDGLQAVLLSIIGSVGQYATFAGVADPSTNPGAQDGNVFYIATKSGVYPNFGGLEVKYGGLSIFENSTGSWVKKDISIETLPNVFDGNKVNNIVQEGGISDVFNVDPKVGDLLYSKNGDFGDWGIITDAHLEGEWLYITYTWGGYVNTIKLDKDGQEARYVNRYKKPTVFDAESVLSASAAGNMQDYFLIKDPDNPTQSFFEFWKVGDLIGSPKGGIIVSDILNPGGLDNTMMYIYGGEIVTIVYKAQSPAKILSVSKAKIGSPEDAANATGSLYARVAFNKKEIGTSTDEAKADGSLYARIKYLMDKKNYKRYNRNLLDKLTTQSTPEEITAAFTPIGESSFRRPKEGDVFLEGTGQWLGSGRDFIVIFCSEYWLDWTMICVGAQKEVAVSFTEYNSTRKISAYKTRDIGWTEELVKNKGTSYVRAVNDVLLRKLYEACDAVYNADDDTYTLNEVKLTPQEMYDIYINQNMWNVRENIISWCDYPHNPKTNIPPYQSLSSGALGCHCIFVAYVNDSLETFKLCKSAADTNEQGWLITSFDYAFQGCKNLRKIIGVIQFGSVVKLSQNRLIALPALEDVRFKFAQDAWIKDSPKLSYDSVKFMAEKSTNGSRAITISLHADVFAKLSGTASDDAYTQSGHTKEEWMAIVTTAQGRSVSFAEAV